MLGVPQEASVRYDDGGNGAELLEDFSSVVEPPHMGVAAGEKAIPPWVAWVILDREDQFRQCLSEAPAEEMCVAYIEE